jgi:hypothetical protein
MRIVDMDTTGLDADGGLKAREVRKRRWRKLDIR